jgi:hypothetical protein
LLQNLLRDLALDILAAGFSMNDDKWRHFRGDVILWAVRWYCKCGCANAG